MNLRFCLTRVQGRGAGLGNELIPWARAFLAAQVVGARCLHPAFGLNTRRYWRHFGTPRYDWVMHKTLERLLPVVEFKESDYLDFGGGDFVSAFRQFADAKGLHTRSSYVLVTEGMWGGYRHIAAARDFIYSTLYQSQFAARNLLQIADRLDKKKLIVAMHVRLGDFGAVPSQLADYQGRFNLALPLQWYRNVALSIQRQLGDKVQFLVVSDGSAEQLRPLLNGLDAVTTSDIPDSDCSDLLALANADLLVCSVSSFSTTAAFLSNAPYLWFEPNLQKHPEGCYSIWGHEPMQTLATGATAQSIRQYQTNGTGLNGRGIATPFNGVVSPSTLEHIAACKIARSIDADLVLYGVTPVRQLCAN